MIGTEENVVDNAREGTRMEGLEAKGLATQVKLHTCYLHLLNQWRMEEHGPRSSISCQTQRHPVHT
jgi:hypothetical protein